jgi:hypothetical protein
MFRLNCHRQGADTILLKLTEINYVVYNAYAYQTYKLKFTVAFFPQASPPTPCTHHYPPPYAPHALPISFVSILPPAQYWARSTDHSAPRYAAYTEIIKTFSNLQYNTIKYKYIYYHSINNIIYLYILTKTCTTSK